MLSSRYGTAIAPMSTQKLWVLEQNWSLQLHHRQRTCLWGPILSWRMAARRRGVIFPTGIATGRSGGTVPWARVLNYMWKGEVEEIRGASAFISDIWLDPRPAASFLPWWIVPSLWHTLLNMTDYPFKLWVEEAIPFSGCLCRVFCHNNNNNKNP